MEVYQPKPLAVEASTVIFNIALQIAGKNVVIVIGAGVSKAPPTCLPLGPEIARKLKQRLGYTELAEYVKDLPEEDLLPMADAAESQSKEALVIVQKMILDSFEFKTARPNYAHLAVALLMAEATTQVLSTNWDTCIERAATMAYSDVVACRQPDELRAAGSSAILLKLHGCAEIENSIRVSSQQVTEPPWWLEHQIGAAIERNWVVFLGVGSVAPYVRRTIITILDRSKDPEYIFVVAHDISKDWNDLLANQGEKRRITLSAEEFLDDVLRALTLIQLSRVDALARQIMEHTPVGGIDTESATKETIEFLRQHPAHCLWLWMRRCTIPPSCGPTVLDSTFIQFIMALAMIHSVSPLEDLGMIGEVVFIRCTDFLVELAWAKEPVTSDILYDKKISSLKADKQKNMMPPDKPFIILVQGSVGPLPPPTMPESIVDTPTVEDIIEGPQTLGDRWIPLEALLRVNNRDSLCDLIGVCR